MSPWFIVACTGVIMCSIAAFGQVDVPPIDFPIGIYSIPEGELAEVAAAGFNCTVNYTTDPVASRDYIEAAAKAGIKVVAYPIYPQAKIEEPGGEAALAEAVNGRKHFDNLMAWYLTDEPELNKQSPELITRLNALVKSLDPSRPTCLVMWSWKDYPRFARIADIFMVDPYPVPSEPISNVYDRVSRGIEASGGGKVWCVPQAFSWQAWRRQPFEVHRPTPEEFRNMTYQALVAGARGIIYWVYKGSQYYVRDYPVQWEADKRMAGELKRMAPIITYGQTDLQTAMTAGAAVRGMFRTFEGRRYATVVNLSRRKRHVQLTATLASAMTDIFEDRKVAGDEGRFDLDLEPLGVRVFLLE